MMSDQSHPITLSMLNICLLPHAISILELLQSTDNEAEAKALKTTQVPIQAMYNEGADVGLSDSQKIERLVREASSDECVSIVKEPEENRQEGFVCFHVDTRLTKTSVHSILRTSADVFGAKADCVVFIFILQVAIADAQAITTDVRLVIITSRLYPNSSSQVHLHCRGTLSPWS
ncbi:hypothetical protein QCA50_007118 [Cerrena zonata]|uniref:Uncharacterized protein n=1 Tax=Cerrena zonata TaxID=2478898 RepID=A0AAW0GCR9_9APHY